MLDGIAELNQELNSIAGETKNLGSPIGIIPSSELVDLEAYQKERNRIIAEFDKKIASIEAEISTLDGEIAKLEGEISSWTKEVENLQLQVDIWQKRKETAEFLYDALVRNYKWEINNACEAFNPAWSDYAKVERVATLWWDYVKIYMPPDTLVHQKARSIEVRDILVTEANKQLATAQSNFTKARNTLSAVENNLEAKTRHMRDLELAKEAAEEEKRGALALWEGEYQAAQERKRIEIDSIARDVALGYPTMDAETARNIAEMAYAEALRKGFTRLADAMEVASDLADEWERMHITPHYTTKTITCSSCGTKLEITVSDIEEHNRDLTCPQCGASIGRGIQARIIELPKPPPPTYTCPYCGATFSSQAELDKHIRAVHIAGIPEWLKKYWPYFTVAGVGTGITIGILAKKKK